MFRFVFVDICVTYASWIVWGCVYLGEMHSHFCQCEFEESVLLLAKKKKKKKPREGETVQNKKTAEVWAPSRKQRSLPRRRRARRRRERGSPVSLLFLKLMRRCSRGRAAGGEAEAADTDPPMTQMWVREQIKRRCFIVRFWGEELCLKCQPWSWHWNSAPLIVVWLKLQSS